MLKIFFYQVLSLCGIDLLQDFPSIYQVLEKLIEYDIITIFSVAKNVTDGLILSNIDIYSVSVLSVYVCIKSCMAFTVAG